MNATVPNIWWMFIYSIKLNQKKVKYLIIDTSTNDVFASMPVVTEWYLGHVILQRSRQDIDAKIDINYCLCQINRKNSHWFITNTRYKLWDINNDKSGIIVYRASYSTSPHIFSLAHGVRRTLSPTEGLQRLQKLYLVIAIVQQYTAPKEFFIQQRMEEKSKYEILLERMDVDDYLLVVGTMGKYQWITTILIGCLTTVFSAQMFVSIFTQATPQFWLVKCTVNQCWFHRCFIVSIVRWLR